jgi:hypothetical protein
MEADCICYLRGFKAEGLLEIINFGQQVYVLVSKAEIFVFLFLSNVYWSEKFFIMRKIHNEARKHLNVAVSMWMMMSLLLQEWLNNDDDITYACDV